MAVRDDEIVEEEEGAEENLTLSEILEIQEKVILGKLHTGMLAYVIEYDAKRRRCTAQPIVRGRYNTGESVRFPAIPNIPVMHLVGGGFGIIFPLRVNDTVFLSFSERSIDEWKAANGADITPRILRRFDLSDALAYPLVSPAKVLPNVPLLNSEDSMVWGEVENLDGMLIEISDGQISITGIGGVELLSLMQDHIGACQVGFAALGQFATALSTSMDPAVVSAAAALVTALTTIPAPVNVGVLVSLAATLADLITISKVV